jgi:hypothetical protein
LPLTAPGRPEVRSARRIFLALDKLPEHRPAAFLPRGQHTRHENGVSSESPFVRRNPRVSADSLACGIIALTGGSRSATADCTVFHM